LRTDVLAAVVRGVDVRRVLFEAPTKDLQVELITALGPAVNLGNIAPADLISLETLRRGLRGDTLLTLAAPMEVHHA
jgi:phosphosulfolactate synthase